MEKEVKDLIKEIKNTMGEVLENTIATFDGVVKKSGTGGHIIIPAKFVNHKAHVRISKKKIKEENKKS